DLPQLLARFSVPAPNARRLGCHDDQLAAAGSVADVHQVLRGAFGDAQGVLHLARRPVPYADDTASHALEELNAFRWVEEVGGPPFVSEFRQNFAGRDFQQPGRLRRASSVSVPGDERFAIRGEDAIGARRREKLPTGFNLVDADRDALGPVVWSARTDR